MAGEYNAALYEGGRNFGEGIARAVQNYRQWKQLTGENQGVLAALASMQGAGGGTQSAPPPQAAAAVANMATPTAPNPSADPAGEVAAPAPQNPSLDPAGEASPPDPVKQYAANKSLNDQGQAHIEQNLTIAKQAGQLPNLLKYLPQDGQKLLAKMQQNGALGLSDTMKLSGMLHAGLDTLGKLQQQQADQQKAALLNRGLGLANDSTAMQNQLQGAQLGPQLDALKKMGTLSQGSTQNLDPITAFSVNYFRTYGAMPPKELLEKVVQRQTEMVRPVGVAYAGTETDEDGNGKADIYNRVSAKGDGSVIPDKTPIRVPYNAPPPDRLVDAKTGNPIQNSAKADNPDGKLLVQGAKYNDALANAHANLIQAQGSLRDVNGLMSAADKLSQSATGGSFASAFMAPGGAARVAAALGSPQAQQFNAQAARVGAQMMSTLKGMTRNKNEFTYAEQLFPMAGDDPATRAQKLAQFSTTANFMVKRQSAVKSYLAQGYSEGKAQDKAAEDVPFPMTSETSGDGNQGQGNQADAGPARANPNGGAMSTVATAEQFAALPKGAIYRTPKGAIRVKN